MVVRDVENNMPVDGIVIVNSQGAKAHGFSQATCQRRTEHPSLFQDVKRLAHAAWRWHFHTRDHVRANVNA